MDHSDLLDEVVVALAELGVPVRTDGDALVVDGVRTTPTLVARAHPTPADLATMAGLFRAAGVDVLHASTRRFWEAEWDGDGRNLAGWTRTSGLPVITVGSVGLDNDVMDVFMKGVDPGPRVGAALGELAAGIAAGHYDMVAVGRALIGDPDFVAKVAAGNHAAIRTFRRDDLGKLEWDLSIVEEAHSA